MKINLNWEIKYNLYMRYKNGKDVMKIMNELKSYENFNIAGVSNFENTLNYWGETYIKNIKFRSSDWLQNKIEELEISEIKNQ